MPESEPELTDERDPTTAPEAVADEPTPEQPIAPDPPLDQPVLPNPTPPPENFHVHVWPDPVTFACLRCALREVTLEEIQYHLQAAHGETPVPTPLAAQYIPPNKAPASGEEALMMMGRVEEPAEETPIPEEHPIAETVTVHHEEQPV